MGIYDNIKNACNSKGISINKLEKDLGFARSSINKFNTNSPSIDKIRLIAGHLNVSVDDLLGNDLISENEMPENIRAVARDLMELPEENRKLAIEMIKMMSQRGKEAKKK